MKTFIKLCGFKYIEDIIFATSLNINYLGMIFVEKNAQRTVNLDTAILGAKICKRQGHKICRSFFKSRSIRNRKNTY